MTWDEMLKELRYPNEEFLWYLNSPESKSLLLTLIQTEFPLLFGIKDELASEIYNWLYLVHDNFIKEKDK